MKSLGRTSALMNDSSAVRTLAALAVDESQTKGLRRAAAEVLVEARWRWEKVRVIYLMGLRKNINDDVVREIIIQAAVLGCI